MITLTGKTADEVVEIMKRKLDAGAYSAVPHASYLTEIDPAYLREALTEAFGLMGYGWYLSFDALDLNIVDRHGTKKHKETGEILSEWDEFAVTLLTARFHFCYREKKDGEILITHPILTTGSSTNRAKGDAIEGSITNALGKAAKKLLWQLDVYKGKLTHNNAGRGSGTKKKKAKKGSKSNAKKSNGNGISLTPESLLEIRSHAIMDPGEFTPTEFWSVANGLLVSKEDADAIVKETSGWADALIAIVDNYGGPEIAALIDGKNS